MLHIFIILGLKNVTLCAAGILFCVHATKRAVAQNGLKHTGDSHRKKLHKFLCQCVRVLLFRQGPKPPDAGLERHPLPVAPGDTESRCHSKVALLSQAA